MVSYLLRLMGFLLRSSVSLSWRHLKDRYDIVHVHNIPDFEVFAALLPKLTGCKVILDIHDIVPELFCDKFKTSPRSMFFRLLVAAERMSAKFSDHVIISNDIWLQSIVRRSVQREKCSVILNYPDPSIFSAARYPRDNGSRQIILYPGSLNQHQGLDIAIGAFALIRDRIPNADLHIYGEGPAKPALSRMIKDLRLEDRVLLRDSLPMEEVAKVMANAACGIVPKRAHGFGNEAFSTKILEFMALGVPLIVSETRIDRFYFNDDLVLYFRSEDERDLGDKIVTLLQNEHLRMRLVSNALQFIAKNSWDTKEQDYLSLINRLCGVESATRLTVGE
jgi:glycosyltransferase involved in cell wall biosynthesis